MIDYICVESNSDEISSENKRKLFEAALKKLNSKIDEISCQVINIDFSYSSHKVQIGGIHERLCCQVVAFIQK